MKLLLHLLTSLHGPSRHFVAAQYSVAFGEEQTSKAAPSPRSYRRAANSIDFVINAKTTKVGLAVLSGARKFEGSSLTQN